MPGATLAMGTSAVLEQAEAGVQPSSALYAGKRAVVVGAGPCGSLTAIYLARQGFSVDVFERTESSVLSSGARSVGPRSYNILLSRRSLAAMAGAGVTLPADQHVVADHVARYRGKVKFFNPTSEYSKLINRGLLAGHLISEALRQFPDRIKFHFDSELADVSLNERRARFVNCSSGKQTELQYDLLLGADGARSKVREAFQAQVPGFSATQLKDMMEYKTVLVPTLSHVDPKAGTAFFSLLDQQRNASLIGSPDLDGTLRAVYILEEGTHEKMTSVQDYVTALTQSFPIFTEEHCQVMAKQLVNNPISSGGLITRCSQLHAPSAVLLGDAGHSMWPSLGQGANAALEDALVLDAALTQAAGDLSSVPERFSAERLPDALAICELTQRGMGGTKARAAGVSWYIAKIIAQMTLNKVLPWLVPAPIVMAMNDSLTRYSEILRKSDAHSRIADVLGIALLALAVMGVALLLRPWLGPALANAAQAWK